MLVIDERNINGAWHAAKMFLNERGVPRPSRNGPTLEIPEPVATVYRCPTERVLFDERRDCNPTFHLMESLWMLQGRRDVKWISQFNSRIHQYSDDGEVFHGAYGYRWRHHFDMYGGAEDGFADQLSKIIAILKQDPTSRRAVLAMWDPVNDLWAPWEMEQRGNVPRDLPCNCSVMFKVRDGTLQMTVCNRSNDILFGAYGANVVHLSVMQEYMAAMIGVAVGSYTQISDSWHAYQNEHWERCGGSDTSCSPRDLYAEGVVRPSPLVDVPEHFDDDLNYWISGMELTDGLKEANHPEFRNAFFNAVATPMWNSWFSYKAKDYRMARMFSNEIEASDWRQACWEWLERRIKAKTEKQAEVTA